MQKHISKPISHDITKMEELGIICTGDSSGNEKGKLKGL
jgi:hypothetical protein